MINFGSDETSKDSLQKKAEIGFRIILNELGLDLNWGEFLSLKYYLRCFTSAFAGGKDVIPESEAHYHLYLHLFGLDEVEMGKEIRTYEEGKGFILKEFGLDFVGDERFKEYCRRRVEMWRDERELI